MSEERFKELGKYFLDISKYIATTVIISLLFSKIGDDVAILVVASVMCAIFLVWGLSCINKKEKQE